MRLSNVAKQGCTMLYKNLGLMTKQFLYETETKEFYKSNFQDKEVIIRVDKKTGETMLSGESLANIFGFNGAQEMINSDTFKEFYKDYVKKVDIQGLRSLLPHFG